MRYKSHAEQILERATEEIFEHLDTADEAYLEGMIAGVNLALETVEGKRK